MTEAHDPAHRAITAVVFDLGGVLIDWDPRHLYRRLFDGDEAAMEAFLATVTTQEWNAQQDRGRPWAVAIDELVARHPEHAELIRAYRARWHEMLGGPIDGTVEVAAMLRERGIPLYALTNWSAETFPQALDLFEFLAWFDGIVVSGAEGMAKPDEAIFRLLLDRFGLDPAATAFIDDSAANVAKARELGIDAIRFRGADDLRDELVARGLLDAERGLGPAPPTTMTGASP